MGIRVIVTDIGSVLFRFDPEHRLALLMERTGMDRGRIQERLFDSGFEARCEAGELTPDGIREQVAAMTGFDGDTDELSELWASAFELDRGVLDALGDSGLTLAVFSNNGPLFADYFDQRFPEAASWFRHRYFASRLGARKPGATAFELVETRLWEAVEAAPDQLLLVDDDRDNTAAAAQRGWHAHTFTDVESLQQMLA